jgi:transglutaminase-like putative cysteine protease
LGQAKLRRAALESAIPPADVQTRVHEAVMRTLKGFGVPGVADCVYHAAATVGALKAAGIDAEIVVGAAWWAVGPGAADTIVHGYDQSGRMVAHHVLNDVKKSLLRLETGIVDIHAWAGYSVAGTPFVVDMTTYQLPDKARRISEADGLPLNVTIPIEPYYWGRIPADKPWAKARPGDWCFTPVPEMKALSVDALGPIVGDMMTIAAMAYSNPECALDLYDIETGKPVADAMADVWSSFDDQAAFYPR